ncbi:unnamed protein product [Microthlaspi erraticum]|uniref:Uncharacterized protein n=1 Tax=Microthlaspi erraticum TaxID=1685480 RepID=A0A6D2JKU4_9BRAS|nr:unnamed protein product [Microthlaspi erraticum]
MDTFHKWHPKEYFFVRINDRDILIRQMAFKYKTNHQHVNSGQCLCNHDQNLAMGRGWFLYEYKLEANLIFCLTYKPIRSSLRHCPIRAKTVKDVYEGKEVYPGNPLVGLRKLIYAPSLGCASSHGAIIRGYLCLKHCDCFR